MHHCPVINTRINTKHTLTKRHDINLTTNPFISAIAHIINHLTTPADQKCRDHFLFYLQIPTVIQFVAQTASNPCRTQPPHPPRLGYWLKMFTLSYKKKLTTIISGTCQHTYFSGIRSIIPIPIKQLIDINAIKPFSFGLIELTAVEYRMMSAYSRNASCRDIRFKKRKALH